MKKRNFLSEGEEKLIDFYFRRKANSKYLREMSDILMKELSDEGYDVEELIRNHTKK